MTLLEAPVSQRAFVGTLSGGGLGGIFGSKPRLTSTSVMMRLSLPVAFTVRAWKFVVATRQEACYQFIELIETV